ncbi:hypothetical protein HK405_000534, partial [Cladochytrium tenue]
MVSRWRCDQCGRHCSGSTMRFRCTQGCDYDECRDCLRSSGSSTVRAQHPHPLNALTSQRPWACDVCLNDFSPSALRMCCPVCNYDECSRCFDAITQLPASSASRHAVTRSLATPATSRSASPRPQQPPHPHALTVSRAVGWQCDRCHAYASSTQLHFGCRSCNYDECSACILTSGSRVRPPSHPHPLYPSGREAAAAAAHDALYCDSCLRACPDADTFLCRECPYEICRA